MARPDWHVRTERWPNGRVYYVVQKWGTDTRVAGRKGGVAIWYDRADAEAVRDEMNGRPQKAAKNTLIED